MDRVSSVWNPEKLVLPCEPGIEVEHAHMGVKQGGQVLSTEILSRNWDGSVKASSSVPPKLHDHGSESCF